MSSNRKETNHTESLRTNDETAVEELSFKDALQEIEQILEQIEGEEVDIDELAGSLGRAASLLEVCRSKIRKAEAEVEQVSQRLVPDEDG